MNSQNTFDSKVLSNHIGASSNMGGNTQAAGGPNDLSNILSQEKSTNNELPLPKTTHNFDMYRTLSAVTEDCDGEELGSISINANSLLGQARTSAKKSHQLATKQSLFMLNRFGASPEEHDEFVGASPDENDEDEDEIIRKDSKGSKSEGDEESDQDKLLFESNFVEEKGRANSFNSDFGEENSKQEESNDSR